MTTTERAQKIADATKVIEKLLAEIAKAKIVRHNLLPVITEPQRKKCLVSVGKQESLKKAGLGVTFRLPTEGENKVKRVKCLKSFDDATKRLHKALTETLPDIVATVKKLTTVTGYIVKKLDNGNQSVKLTGEIGA